jgi:hypothetical protein
VSDIAEVVRRWLAAFAGPEVDAAAVSELLHPDATFVERPNRDGTKLRSHSALFFTLRNGLVWRVESYDAFPASEEPERTAGT